jgi:hypothetical protein
MLVLAMEFSRSNVFTTNTARLLSLDATGRSLKTE